MSSPSINNSFVWLQEKEVDHTVREMFCRKRKRCSVTTHTCNKREKLDQFIDDDNDGDDEIFSGVKFPSVASQKSIKYKRFRIFRRSNCPKTATDVNILETLVQQDDYNASDFAQKENVESSPTWLNFLSVNDMVTVTQTQNCTSPGEEIQVYERQIPQTQKILYLFIDVETTDSDAKVGDILQISAVGNLTEDDVFNEYVLPIQEISKITFNLTGLQMIAGELYRKTIRGTQFLPAVDLKTGLVRFVNYVQSLKQRYGTIVVVGHNVHFDLRFLYNKLVQECLWLKFELNVDGVVDSLALFRRYYPERSRRNGGRGYSLGSLAKYFSTDTFMGHDSLEDVRMLKCLSALIHEHFPTVTISLPDYRRKKLEREDLQ